MVASRVLKMIMALIVKMVCEIRTEQEHFIGNILDFTDAGISSCLKCIGTWS